MILLKVLGKHFHDFLKVRIVLNKADEITAEELLRIQGNLIWNVSPLMASMEPPTLYAGSFWSKPYKVSWSEWIIQYNIMMYDVGWGTKTSSQVTRNVSPERYKRCHRQESGE